MDEHIHPYIGVYSRSLEQTDTSLYGKQMQNQLGTVVAYKFYIIEMLVVDKLDSVSKELDKILENLNEKEIGRKNGFSLLSKHLTVPL